MLLVTFGQNKLCFSQKSRWSLFEFHNSLTFITLIKLCCLPLARRNVACFDSSLCGNKVGTYPSLNSKIIRTSFTEDLQFLLLIPFVKLYLGQLIIATVIFMNCFIGTLSNHISSSHSLTIKQAYSIEQLEILTLQSICIWSQKSASLKSNSISMN